MSYPVVHLAVLAIGFSYIGYGLYQIETLRAKIEKDASPEAFAARRAEAIAEFHEQRAQGIVCFPRYPGDPRYPSDGRDEAPHLYHSCGRCRRDRE
jgi:hypothetical protein